MTVDLDLFKTCFYDTGEVLAAIPAARWPAQSPCTEWTVRQVAEHLVEALDAIAAMLSGEPADRPADLLVAYGDATRRCLTAFDRPAALAGEYPSPAGPMSGLAAANVALSESLVHGWDLATGASLPYSPDPAVVATVAAFPDGPSAPGFFADPVPVPAGAPRLVALLARRGRTAW